MTTVNLRNFGLANVNSIDLVAATPSARVELPNRDLTDVMVVNEGLVTVFVRTGDASVVADANAMPVLPGEKGVYQRGDTTPPTTHIAAFVSSGTQAIVIIQGIGV